MPDTIQAVITAISTVGFPIACCCFLLWQSSKQDQYHREQMEKLRCTIDENTKTLEKLSDLIKEVLKK